MKTFHIKDEDGKEFEVKEIEKDAETENKNPEQHDNEASGLSAEEIASLKKLAAGADKLLALIATNDADEDKDDEDDKDKVDDEEETIEEKIESVVDTDEDEAGCTHDSIKSAGAIEKQSTNVNDSIDIQDEIADAWSKRYMGGNE